MFQISGIIVDKSGRDYSGNMENAHGLKTERSFFLISYFLAVHTTHDYSRDRVEPVTRPSEVALSARTIGRWIDLAWVEMKVGRDQGRTFVAGRRIRAQGSTGHGIRRTIGAVA